MATSAVKILFSSSHSILGAELQDWLSEMAGQVIVTGLSMDSNDHGHCLAVLYTSGPGPAYQGSIWFSFRHSTVEETANADLLAEGAAHGQFVALGSNRHGHCLCVIGSVE